MDPTGTPSGQRPVGTESACLPLGVCVHPPSGTLGCPSQALSLPQEPCDKLAMQPASEAFGHVPSDLSAAPSLQHHGGLELKHASLPSPGASRDRARAQCADYRDLFPPVKRAGEHCPVWSDLEEDTREV